MPYFIEGDSAQAKAPYSSFITPDGSSLIADIAESRINGVVNISSTKVIKTGEQQLLNPFFNDPFSRDFFGHRFNGIPRESRARNNHDPQETKRSGHSRLKERKEGRCAKRFRLKELTR